MLPAILDMLIALAGLAIGLFVSKLWKKSARWLPRVVCIGLIVLFVTGVVWKAVFQIQGLAQTEMFRTQLLDKIEKAEALGKDIPNGCPPGVGVKPWDARVEALRTEAAKELGQAFAVDRGDYPHDCPLEWVRNRLYYFLTSWQAAALVLAKP